MAMLKTDWVVYIVLIPMVFPYPGGVKMEVNTLTPPPSKRQLEKYIEVVNVRE